MRTVNAFPDLSLRAFDEIIIGFVLQFLNAGKSYVKRGISSRKKKGKQRTIITRNVEIIDEINGIEVVIKKKKNYYRRIEP